MNLTLQQRQALRLRQKGKETFIIDWTELDRFPADHQSAMQELPSLVSMGLMHTERLTDHKFMYRISATGRKALAQCHQSKKI